MAFTVWKRNMHVKYHMTIPVGFLPALRQVTKMPAANFHQVHHCPHLKSHKDTSQARPQGMKWPI